MKIAIFGGSFDPIHIGHEQIVTKALKKLDIKKLYLIPNYLNPLKNSSYLHAKTRLKLLRKLFKNTEKVCVSSYETKQEKAVFSIDTIKHMQKKYKPSLIYLIVGADSYNNFHLWKDYKEIKKLVKLVVVTRDSFSIKKKSSIKILKVNIKISSSELKKTFNIKYVPKKIKKDLKIIFKKKD